MKTIKIYSAAILVASIILHSCNSDDNNDPAATQKAKVAIINASPSADTYFFSLNGEKINSDALAYSDKLEYNGYRPDTYKLSINTATNPQVLVETPLELKSGEAFSIYLSDISSKLSIVVIKDDLTLTVGKSKIRFVNMSPGTRSIDLKIAGQSQHLFPATAFKGFRPFSVIQPTPAVTFEIRDSATDSLLATLPNVKLEAEQFYTLWAKDEILTPGIKKIALGLIQNK